MPVDDHEMQITHVLRGEEWLPSAPRHKLLFQALGYEMPAIIHVSLILGPDRSKLSKRHGAQSVLEYRDQGYLPEAVLNFLALLGWSLDDKTEIISRDDLVRHFTLDRLIASPAVFNIEKLDWLNGEYMRAMPVDKLAELLIEWLEKPESEGGLPASVPRPLDIDYTTRIMPLVRERVKLLSQARDMMAFFYLPDDLELDADMLLGKRFKEDRSEARLLLSEALVEAEAVKDWTHDVLEAAFRALTERAEVKAGDLFMLMRVAITGRTVSPPLFETMAILGRDRCIQRLRIAMNSL
jgi:glutamyl-tRNA synthetase